MVWFKKFTQEKEKSLEISTRTATAELPRLKSGCLFHRLRMLNTTTLLDSMTWYDPLIAELFSFVLIFVMWWLFTLLSSEFKVSAVGFCHIQVSKCFLRVEKFQTVTSYLNTISSHLIGCFDLFYRRTNQMAWKMWWGMKYLFDFFPPLIGVYFSK